MRLTPQQKSDLDFWFRQLPDWVDEIVMEDDGIHLPTPTTFADARFLEIATGTRGSLRWEIINRNPEEALFWVEDMMEAIKNIMVLPKGRYKRKDFTSRRRAHPSGFDPNL